MANNRRQLDGNFIQDPGQIHNVEHNPAAGGKKTLDVGPHLLPLPIISGGVLAYTTNATTAVALNNPGISLAVYNNSGSVGSITLGESSSQASLAAGVTDSSGHVGIPCAPNSWTRISCGLSNFVIASAATLLVFMVDDHTSIKAEVANVYAGS